jgi:phosphoribosyl 1,2-cyclic phosphodiesterase
MIRARIHTSRRGALEFCALASGSKGNAVYVGSEGRGVLVDAGLPGREIERRMAAAGIDPRRVAAVVLTHDHRDHASGVGVWARRYGVAVHAPADTAAALRHVARDFFEGVEVMEFLPGEPFEAAGMSFEPFPTSHDASGSVGFCIRAESTAVGFATDLGMADDGVRRGLAGADLLFLESNHDEEMLTNGPYPWFLKKRILSARGHLANRECAALAAELVHPGLRALVLGHLSEVNNEPRLAFDSARETLTRFGAEEDVTLLVARQDRPGRILRI